MASNNFWIQSRARTPNTVAADASYMFSSDIEQPPMPGFPTEDRLAPQFSDTSLSCSYDGPTFSVPITTQRSMSLPTPTTTIISPRDIHLMMGAPTSAASVYASNGGEHGMYSNAFPKCSSRETFELDIPFEDDVDEDSDDVSTTKQFYPHSYPQAYNQPLPQPRLVSNSFGGFPQSTYGTSLPHASTSYGASHHSISTPQPASWDPRMVLQKRPAVESSHHMMYSSTQVGQSVQHHSGGQYMHYENSSSLPNTPGYSGYSTPNHYYVSGPAPVKLQHPSPAYSSGKWYGEEEEVEEEVDDDDEEESTTTEPAHFRMDIDDDQEHEQAMAQVFAEHPHLQQVQLPPSKTPCLDALAFCVLLRLGAAPGTTENNLTVTECNKMLACIKHFCPKQNQTQNNEARIKALKRWFNGIPSKKRRNEVFLLEMKPDKRTAIKKIIRKMEAYVQKEGLVPSSQL